MVAWRACRPSSRRLRSERELRDGHHRMTLTPRSRNPPAGANSGAKFPPRELQHQPLLAGGAGETLADERAQFGWAAGHRAETREQTSQDDPSGDPVGGY